MTERKIESHIKLVFNLNPFYWQTASWLFQINYLRNNSMNICNYILELLHEIVLILKGQIHQSAPEQR